MVHVGDRHTHGFVTATATELEGSIAIPQQDIDRATAIVSSTTIRSRCPLPRRSAVASPLATDIVVGNRQRIGSSLREAARAVAEQT